ASSPAARGVAARTSNCTRRGETPRRRTTTRYASVAADMADTLAAAEVVGVVGRVVTAPAVEAGLEPHEGPQELVDVAASVHSSSIHLSNCVTILLSADYPNTLRPWSGWRPSPRS